MKRSLLVFSTCILSVCGALAATDRKSPPPAAPLPAATFPQFKEIKLENGLKLFLFESDKQPTVSFRLVIKSGGINEGEKHGLAGMVAALLNKGTANFTAEEFARRSDLLGISVEAAVSDDAIYISATGLSKYALQILEFLSEAVLQPLFPLKQLEKERLKTLSQIEAQKKEPAALAAKLRDQVVFGEHPYGAHATTESIHKITREDVAAFHKKFFAPNNASLAVVGDFDTDKLLPKIKETFSDWERRKLPAIPPPRSKIEGVSIHLVDRPGSVQSNIIVAAKGIPRSNPDTPGLTVVNSVLGGGFSGRLFQNLRERHGFTYGSSSYFDQKKLGGVFSATAEVRNEVTGKAITEILEELKRIRQEPIPEPELDLQKQYVAGNYLLSLENDRRNVERVQDIDLYGLPKDYYQKLIPRVRGLDPKEARSLAHKYITAEDVVVIVVGDAAEVKAQLETLGQVTVYDTELQVR